jgi:hypothetical protein
MNAPEERTKYEGAEKSTTHIPPNTSQPAVSDRKKVLIVGAGKPSSLSRPISEQEIPRK